MNQDSDSFSAINRIRVLLIIFGAILGLWIAFAKLVVPPVIESAYRGESLPFFNSIIEARATHPVEEYLRDWAAIAQHITLAFLGFGLLGLALIKVTSSPAFFRRYVGEATPGTLGAIRMLTCGIILVYILIEDLPSIAFLPPDLRDPGGLMALFYALPIGFDRLVTSETGLRVFKWLAAVILFLGLIGWKTRFVIPLGAVCWFLIGGILRDYSFSWHQGWAPLYLITILSFTPCGDGWSVDRLRKVYLGLGVPAADQPSPIYGWARYVCWVAIALAYVGSGLSKLLHGGLFWWNATNMRSFFYYDTLTPREFDWAWSLYLVQAPDALFALLGLIALVGEIAFGLVLFSSSARRILPVLMIMMHSGIFLFQRILFFDLMLLQLLFFDFTRIRGAIARRLEASRGRIEVLYDGDCPLCRRTVRVLAFFDLFARLELLDFRCLDLADYNRRHKMALTIEDLDKEMYVISRGQAHPGYYGYRVLALALPAFWPLSPLLFLPGISWAGERVYSYVAGNRLNLLKCDADCPRGPAEGSHSAVVRPMIDARRHFRYALAVSAFTVVFVYCVFYNIGDRYPLTTWALYDFSNTSGKIDYLKVFAQYESGSYSPARLEDGVGALGYDGRYIPFIERCFGEDVYKRRFAIMGTEVGKLPDVDICKKFLTASASAYNMKKARSGGKLTKYEIQMWSWDFRSYPSDSQHGKLVDHFIFEVKADGSR